MTNEDIKKSIPQKFSALSSIQKIAVIVILTFLAILLFYGIEWWFRADTATALKRKEAALKQTAEGNYRILFNRTKTLHETQALQRQFEHLMKLLPQKSQVDFMLKQITTLGKSGGLTFVYFKPQKPAHHGFYIALPIEMALLGSYHDIAQFISNIAAIPRLITVGNFTLSRPNPSHKQLTMHVTMTIYYLPPQDESEKK